MFDWVKLHAHVLIAIVSGVGVAAASIAANTTGLLPNSVGAWLTAAGVIIAQTVAVLAGGKVSTTESVRLALKK